MKQLLLGLILGTLPSLNLVGQTPPNFATQLEDVLNSHPEVKELQAQVQAEEELISASSALADPKLEWMQEEQAGQKMTFWKISQEFTFPTLYWEQRKVQKSKAEQARQGLQLRRLELRQQILTTLAQLWALKKIEQLLRGEKETLREISRIAEARRVTSGSPQQDEMKAHIEQTKIENELLLLEQQQAELFARWQALSETPLTNAAERVLTDTTLKVPMEERTLERLASTQAPELLSAQATVDQQQAQLQLATSSFWPQMMVSYQQAYGEHRSEGGKTLSLGLTLPLYFWQKQIPWQRTEAYRLTASQAIKMQRTRQLREQIFSGSAKIKSLQSLIKIYKTTLIPQAQSTLNSSRNAYIAGKIPFYDLLDSERLLYSTQIEYYRLLPQLIEAIALLELRVGSSLSSLPFIK